MSKAASGLVAAMVVSAALATAPAAQAYTFGMSAPSFSDASHFQVDVELALAPGEALLSIQFDVTYNAGALGYLGGQPGDLVTTWPLFNASDPGTNPATILVANFQDTPGPASGAVARLDFEVAGQGGIGLGLANIELARDSGLIDPGLITVIPEPQQWALLLAGVGLIGWRAMRKLASCGG